MGRNVLGRKVQGANWRRGETSQLLVCPSHSNTSSEWLSAQCATSLPVASPCSTTFNLRYLHHDSDAGKL